MSQSERFDILILGSGQGASCSLGTWRDRGGAQLSSNAAGSAAPVRTSPACRARMRSGARRSRICAPRGAFGTIAGPVETDMAAVRQRKRDMVNREVELHLQNTGPLAPN